MNKVTLKIALTLKAPLLSQSSERKSFGVDSALACDTNGNYIIPRKLIKGCLKQAWRELNESVGDTKFKADEDRWLGKGSGNESMPGTYLRSPGLLRFDDFKKEEEENAPTLFRIKIDDKRGAVQKGAYQVIEAPYAAGEEVAFIGEISFLADDMETRKIRKALELGLRWITNLGAFESVGFGQLLKVKVEEKSRVPFTPPTPSTSATNAPDFLEIKINPQSPFCISNRRITQNLFESNESIPGGVLKGAIAQTWLSAVNSGSRTIDENTETQRSELGRYFDKIRFTYAFPSRAVTNKRPVQFPYSLVDAGGKLYDVALCDKPLLLETETKGEFVASSFHVDWKNKVSEKVNLIFGFPDLWDKKKLEVHTAIENNRAKDQDLFAYEMIVPDGLDWYAKIDLSEITDNTERANVSAQLESLLISLGIHAFGKTKAEARIYVLPISTIQPFKPSNLSPINMNQWIITLQTPAILCDPKELSQTNDLKKAYEDAWHDISVGALKLVRYFAGQSLAGGVYLHNRFQQGKPYNPYLLTDAGSVFVLESTNANAQAKVNEFFDKGLPLPAWAVQRYGRNSKDGAHWENCPYIPQNGYGEIAVNLDVHTNNQPKGGEYK